MRLLSRWWYHPAEWWQFWYPQSGLMGGTLAGIVFMCFIISAHAQDYGPAIATGKQTYDSLWTELQQKRALLTTSQQQNANDTATILTLRNQVASLQAQLAAIPACPPIVICPICPAPVVCPLPPPPPVVTPPPPLPTDSAVLVWDVVAGAIGYRVYYGTASGVYSQALGAGISTTLTTYTVTGLTAPRYYFAVTAQNAQAESVYSNEVFKDTGTVPPVVDTQAPSVPTGFTAVAVSPTQINLTWNASTDNVGVACYYIYNADIGSALDGTTLVVLKGNVTSYNHTGLLPGTTHSYRVSACDAVPNHSAWTARKTATTPLQ